MGARSKGWIGSFIHRQEHVATLLQALELLRNVDEVRVPPDYVTLVGYYESVIP